jgi:hypothetical protein
MKILFLALIFVLSGEFIIADETNNLNEKTCSVLYNSSIRVKKCTLFPDTDKLLKCGEAMRKLFIQHQNDEKYLEYALKAESKAQKAWDRGAKIMIERRPVTKKKRCGYYLDCLTSYVQSLPMFAPDGRHLKYEQSKIWQEYSKTLLECADGVYTITTGIKKVEEKSPHFKRWMGKNTPRLSRITIKESKQVIFIKPRGGEIINVPLSDSASSDRTSQKYAFDAHKCLFELKEEDEKNKHINIAPVYVFSTDGKGDNQKDIRFTNKTDLNFKISSIEPIIQIKWKDVKSSVPTFHKNGTYIAKNVLLNEQVFHVPKEVRMLMTERNMIAGRALLNPFQAIDSKELCDIKMAEEFLHGTVIWRQAEKVLYEYDIDFRPATSSERREAKRIMWRMKNWSGSYTEEKSIYDSLNNPFHNPKYKGQKRESYDGKEEASSILDVIVEQDASDDDYEPNWAEKDLGDELNAEEKVIQDQIDKDEQKLLEAIDLQMFTK